MICPLSFSQTFRAQITGVVLDSSGAVIPAAEVRATNIDTGVTQIVQTGAQGVYRLLNLQPGPYRVEAMKQGFQRFVQEPVTVEVGDVVTLDIELTLGEVTEQVTVTGEAPLLESESASLGQVVNERSIQELPLNMRNPMALLTVTPGVVIGGRFAGGGGATGQDPGRNFFASDFKVGGGRANAQEVLIDGAPNTTGDRNFVAYIPPVDSTQEFSVQTTSYSAEFGRTTGGVLNMVTKSGTNEFHGVAYEFLRNDNLDANFFFTNRSGQEKPEFNRNQFGANAGGPIIKNKTFFFGAYEGLRQSQPSSFVSTLPTGLQRRGDFSQTFAQNGGLITIHDPESLTIGPDGEPVRSPFPGNVIPQSRFDTVASNAIGFYPAPNIPGDPVTLTNNFISTEPASTDIDKFDIRGDHNFGTSNRLFGRFSYQESENQTPKRWDNVAAPGARTLIDTFTNVTVGDVHTFSPSLIGEFRLSFARAKANQLAESAGFDVESLGFAPNFVEVAAPFFPEFNISDVTPLGSEFFNNQPRNTYSGNFNITKITGTHSIKAGADLRVLRFHALQNNSPTGNFSFTRLMTQGPDPQQSDPNAGHGLASFLLGTGSGGGIDFVQGLSLQRLYHAFYVQDDWKVSPRLTLNLGLRYVIEKGQSERFDRLTYFDPDAPNPLSDQVGVPFTGLLQFLGEDGRSRNQLDTDHNNFAPRFGFAYRLRDETVVRGGYGIFYAPMIVLGIGSLGFNTTTPFVATLDNQTPENFLSNPFPRGFNTPTGERDPLTNTGFGIGIKTRNERTPYVQHWNFGFQQQFGNNLMVEATYLGAKGTKLQFGQSLPLNGLPQELLALGDALNEQVANPFLGVIESGPLSGPTVSRRQLLLPFPQFPSVTLTLPSAASSIYHGAAVKVEKRFSDGLSLLAAYTAGKQIDDSSSQEVWLDQSGGLLSTSGAFADRRLERSVSALDVAQRLVISHVYDLPAGKRRGKDLGKIGNAILGGWTWSGILTFQSGLPIAISRPSVNNGQSAELDGRSIDRWFNTDVFTTAAPFTFGNVGRLLPDVRADGINSYDATLAKNFFISERYRLQFRAEFFNLFNTPQFNFPNGNVASATFGVVNSTAAAPRQIQFALKLFW